MAAAAGSTSHRTLPSFGLIICAGSCSGSYGPSSTAFSAGAFSSPCTMKITRAALFKTGGVSVIRSVYSLPTQLLTTSRRSSLNAFVPGKREAVCPSGPIPSSTRSKRGNWPASNLKLARNSSSYSSAACAAFRFSPLMRCTCFGSTGALASIASVAMRKLLSASSGGTCRSSPKKNWILLQGTFACSSGLFVSSPYSAFGVEPPASATQKESFSRTASRAASKNSAAAVCAIPLASAKILTSRLFVIMSVHSGSCPPQCRRNLTRLGRQLLFSDRSPCAPIPRQQFVGFCRTPGSCGVVRKPFGRHGLPRVQHGLDNLPTRLDHVRALEQSGIPDHAVMQQSLISRIMRASEVAFVVKLHVHQAELHDRPWNLGSKSQGNPFVGLNVNDQLVGLQIGDLGLSKQYEGRSPKLDGNLCRAPLQALSRPQIERHAGPAPVVDLQLQSNIGLGVRCGRYLGFVAISRQSFLSRNPLAVLPPNGGGNYVLRVGNLNGMQDFRLLVAHRVGIKRDRRFHRRQRKQLKEMIGHHVAQSTGRLVETAALFHSHGLGRRNLHAVDEVAVP